MWWTTAEDRWRQQRLCVDITRLICKNECCCTAQKPSGRKQIVNREFGKFHLRHLQPPVCCDYKTNFFTKKA